MFATWGNTAARSAFTTGWLIGVARHKLADHWRRAEREQRGYFDNEAKVHARIDAISLDQRLRHSGRGGPAVTPLPGRRCQRGEEATLLAKPSGSWHASHGESATVVSSLAERR